MVVLNPDRNLPIYVPPAAPAVQKNLLQRVAGFVISLFKRTEENPIALEYRALKGEPDLEKATIEDQDSEENTYQTVIPLPRARSRVELDQMIQSSNRISGMQGARPKNFAKHICSVEGKPVVMGGMAHLVKYNDGRNPVDIVNQLHQAGFDSIISFHDENVRVQDAIDLSEKPFAYHNIYLVDFAPISVDQFDRFYEVVKAEAANNKTIACFCGYGHGRTGTMLASLTLREVLAEKVKQDPNYLYHNQERVTLKMLGQYANEKELQVSPAVYAAVTRTRDFCFARVENTQNIKDLMALENHILEEMRLEAILF